MQRKSINPVAWSEKLGFDQGLLIEGQRRQLVCSGQDSVDEAGQPQHEGDMAAQVELSLDNLADVLAAGDMTFADVVRLSVFTTDVDEMFKNWGAIVARFGEGRFVTSVVGVDRLASSKLLVQLEATAVA